MALAKDDMMAFVPEFSQPSLPAIATLEIIQSSNICEHLFSFKYLCGGWHGVCAANRP